MAASFSQTLSVAVEDLWFSYGTKLAPTLRGIDLELRGGEFFTLLGPSGCGKTTLLWLLAGFRQPERGRILFDGEDVARLPPERRGVGVVFQTYALFPHMSVARNVAYGLKGRGLSRVERDRRVREALELVDLDLERHGPLRPSQLSGGQQQRVALARALAPHPRFLLLDEPLSNLDAALRVATRQRIRDLQRRLGITTLAVTHDQEEALAQSDRLGLMLGGELRQVGTPEDLALRPQSLEAALFFGQRNAVPGELVGGAPGTTAVLRPEVLRLGRALGDQEVEFRGTVDSVEFLGDHRRMTVLLEQPGGEALRIASTHPLKETLPAAGDHVWLKAARTDVWVYSS